MGHVVDNISSRHISCARIRRLLASWCLGPVMCTPKPRKNIDLSLSSRDCVTTAPFGHGAIFDFHKYDQLPNFTIRWPQAPSRLGARRWLSILQDSRLYEEGYVVAILGKSAVLDVLTIHRHSPKRPDVPSSSGLRFLVRRLTAVSGNLTDPTFLARSWNLPHRRQINMATQAPNPASV